MARRRVPQNEASPSVPEGWARFYRVIRAIPRGRVVTYGAVAALAGAPRSARQVGYALAALAGREPRVPWQRVLGARGRGFAAVTIAEPTVQQRQRALLEAEGVRFDARGRVALSAFGWARAYPPASRRSAKR